MQIIPSTPEDIDVIFQRYEEGTSYQKKMFGKHWEGFDRTLIEKEITAHRQWKILIDNEIACVFVTAFQDPFIWQEKNSDPALYLHRIATHPAYRGRHLVRHIVTWATAYAKLYNKQFIRMDTGSGNDKLNNYYTSCGFTYLGVYTYPVTDQLPAHYKGASSLFEIRL